jgi:hypothetical protein
MAEYGQIINPTYDPKKNSVYEAFSNYFNNPNLTKIKDVHSYSMYMVKIYAMLGNAYRYLIIFIPKDINSPGFKKDMSTCEWVTLQTRTLEDSHDIKAHRYQVINKPPLNQKINVTKRDKKQSIYEAENMPLVITLLHTRKDHTYQYHPTGTINSALETFQTIISFKNGT